MAMLMFLMFSKAFSVLFTGSKDTSVTYLFYNLFSYSVMGLPIFCVCTVACDWLSTAELKQFATPGLSSDATVKYVDDLKWK